MKFGVVVCPKCRNAKGVNLDAKSSKCNRCNKSLNPRKLKVFYRTDTESDLIHGVARVNAEIHQGLSEYEELVEDVNRLKELKKKEQEPSDIYLRIALSAAEISDHKRRIEFIAIELASNLDGIFSETDLNKVLEKVNVEDADGKSCIGQLKKMDMIYEPERGRYKII